MPYLTKNQRYSMNELIMVGQVRSNASVFYKVISTTNTTIECNSRKGPTGRYSTKTISISPEIFKTYKLIRNPDQAPITSKTKTIVDWVAETADVEVVDILKKQNASYRKQLIKTKTREKLIIDAIKESLTILPTFNVPKAPKSNSKSYEEIAVLHISDTQIGKVTDTYDAGIAESRLFELVRKVIKITQMRRTAARIDTIHVYLGGDMVEGEEIFPHQAHEIDQSVYDQAVHTVPSIIGRCILMLLEAFPKVKVLAVPGNHGRNGPRGTKSHPKTNWDSVCYAALQAYLLGPEWNPRKELQGRLEMDYQDSWYSVDYVFDWGNLIVHGDQITGGFAGFPWYGAAKKAWGWSDSIDEPWDYLWFGHFHTYAGPVTLNKKIFLANGTTESDNEYAQASLAATGYPCQRLTFFNAEHGLINDNQIYLTKKRVPAKARAILTVSAPELASVKR